MDLEQFYNEDPRRRHSEELEFGRDWTDEANNRCEISWVEATGELYAMREPMIEYSADGLGGMYNGEPKVEQLWIDMIGVVPGRDAIEAVMSGWEQRDARARTAWRGCASGLPTRRPRWATTPPTLPTTCLRISSRTSPA